MLESVRYSNIGDICIKELYFYDEKKPEELVKFCKKNHFTFVPSKDRKSCYKLEKDKFKKLDEIPKRLKIEPQALIFEDSTIKMFEEFDVDDIMFVVNNGLIKGVVHIVDYNNPDIYAELYRMLLLFENNLRKYLRKNDLSDEDFVEWLCIKASREKESNEKKKNNWHKKLRENPDHKKPKYYDHYQKKYSSAISDKAKEIRSISSPFHTFYLRDLLMFAKELEKNEKYKNTLLLLEDVDYEGEKYNAIDVVCDLRNWIAHSKDAAHTSRKSENPIYNVESLKEFIRKVQSFFKVYDRLEILLENIDSKD